MLVVEGGEVGGREVVGVSAMAEDLEEGKGGRVRGCGEGLNRGGVEELGEDVGVRGGGGAGDELGGGRGRRGGFLEGEEGLVVLVVLMSSERWWGWLPQAR